MSIDDAIVRQVETSFEDELIPVLEQYTRIPCLSPAFDAGWQATGAIAKAAELLAGFAASRDLPGLEVETVVLPGLTPVLLFEMPASAPTRAGHTTLVYGHYDKQPPLGQWRAGLAPFEPVREGDRLYGRGTADDGYALFAALAALEALTTAGTGHGRIIGLIEGSEESGSPHLAAYLDHLAERIGALDLVVCLDSGCATYDRLWVTTSLRGVVNATLRVAVLTEGVHSGHAGGIVPSSFRIARRLLSRIEDEHDGAVLLEAACTDIPIHRRTEIADVAAEIGEAAGGEFPTVANLVLGGEGIAERIERGTWRPALSVIGAAGLPPAADAGNVLLPETTLKLSLRLPPNANARAAAEALRSALTEDPPEGAVVEVELDTPADGWDSPKPEPWLQRAIEQASRDRFGLPPRSLGLGGSIPFMATLGRRYPATQFLATGVLGPQSNAHGPNEFLHVPTAKAVACCVADVLATTP